MRVKSVPDVKFCLVFQSESLSVPVMRRVLGDTLPSLGAVGCQVEVADEGIGGPADARGPAAQTGPEPSAPGSEPQTPIAQLPQSGRGLTVMRAFVDNVTLDSQPGRGTVVTMRKNISWSSDAPLRQFQTAS